MNAAGKHIIGEGQKGYADGLEVEYLAVDESSHRASSGHCHCPLEKVQSTPVRGESGGGDGLKKDRGKGVGADEREAFWEEEARNRSRSRLLSGYSPGSEGRSGEEGDGKEAGHEVGELTLEGKEEE